MNGQKKKKEKQKLNPITQLDFYANTHIGLVCYFFVYMKIKFHLN